MTLLVLMILAVMWAAVLLPPWLRGRRESNPRDPMMSFRRQLSVLERGAPGTGGAAPSVAPWGSATIGRRFAGPATSTTYAAGTSYAAGTTYAPAIRPAGRAARGGVITLRQARLRRRVIIGGLLLGALGSLALGLTSATARPLLVGHVLFDLCLAAYLTVLFRVRHEAAEREMKVHFLPDASTRREPALALVQRSGS